MRAASLREVLEKVQPSSWRYLLEVRFEPASSLGNWNPISTAIVDDTGYPNAIDTARQKLLADASLNTELPCPGPSCTQSTASKQAVQGSTGTVIPLARPGEGSGATPTTMSDYLLKISEAVWIPAVAQYLSQYSHPKVAQPVIGGKASKCLAGLCKQFKFSVGREGDYLSAKSILFA